VIRKTEDQAHPFIYHYLEESNTWMAVPLILPSAALARCLTPHDNAASIRRQRTTPSEVYNIHRARWDGRRIVTCRKCERQAGRCVKGRRTCQRMNGSEGNESARFNQHTASLEFPLSCISKALKIRPHETSLPQPIQRFCRSIG